MIDTTHAYEPCVLGAALLPLLRQVPAGCPGRETVDRLADALPAFLPLPAESVPETSPSAGVLRRMALCLNGRTAGLVHILFIEFPFCIVYNKAITERKEPEIDGNV